MKGSGKILSGIAVVTSLMLLYVHFQISSVIVSFELGKVSQTYAAKQELLRRLQFNVNQLKVPRFLEEKMKKNELSLGLPDNVQVVEVPPVMDLPLPATQEVKPGPSFAAVFSRAFGRLIQTAQAKTEPSA